MIKAALFLSLSLSCTSLLAQENKSVFGQDQREILNSHQYPFSSLVRLDLGDGGHCTGALIARDLILTNAHCLRDESGRKRNNIVATIHGLRGFSPSIKATEVVIGTNNYQDHPEADWAVLKISRPYGDVVGYFDLNSSLEIASDYTLAGYSGDISGGNVASVHKNCSFKTHLRSFSLLAHDCDMTKGSSGSPLWRLNDQGRAQVYAVNSAQQGRKDYHDEWKLNDSNLAVPVDNFEQAIKDLSISRNEFGNGLVICNQKTNNVKLAVAFKNEEHAISRGWERIGASECREIKLPKEIAQTKKATKVYAYAKKDDLDGIYHREFCLGGFFGFEKNDSECSSKKIYTEIGVLNIQAMNKIDIR